MNVNRAGPRKQPAARPSVVSARDRHRHQRHSGPGGQSAKARPQRGHLAVAGARAFGKDQHHLAPLQPPQRLLKPGQPQTLAVDGNGVERLNQPAKWREAKQRLASQIVQPPVARQADQHRIEMTLVVREHQHPAGARHIPPPADPNLQKHCGQQPAHDVQEAIPQPLGQRARSHRHAILARTSASSRSTTSSGRRPSVMTSMASAAGRSGPTARLASRWSRCVCSASTSS